MNRTLKTTILSLLLIVASGFAQAQTKQSPIINFHEVTPKVFRGARPENQASFAYLKNLGIKTVIDLQGGDPKNEDFGWLVPYVEPGETPQEIQAEKRSVEFNGMSFMSAPLDSLSLVDEKEAETIRAVLEIMNTPAYQPVYVHCAHGADRTGLVVALYRMKYQGWSAQQAHQEMVQDGHDTLHEMATSGMDLFFLTEALRITFESSL